MVFNAVLKNISVMYKKPELCWEETKQSWQVVTRLSHLESLKFYSDCYHWIGAISNVSNMYYSIFWEMDSRTNLTSVNADVLMYSGGDEQTRHHAD